MKKMETTLLILKKQDKILLAMKKKRLWGREI